jgi:hypothetical protein
VTALLLAEKNATAVYVQNELDFLVQYVSDFDGCNKLSNIPQFEKLKEGQFPLKNIMQNETSSVIT